MRLPEYIQNKQEWLKAFSFYTTMKVRFSETDAFGHVNNTVAFIYFEQARLDFLEARGVMKDWIEQEEVIIVTADLHCDYHAQIKYGDQVDVGVKINKIGSASVDLHYVGVVEGEPRLTGRGTLVQIHAQTGKAIPLSPVIKEKLIT